MSIQAKYKILILEKYPTYSDEYAEMFADVLYQLAFTVVQKFLTERST